MPFVDSRYGPMSRIRLALDGDNLEEPAVDKIVIWNSGDQPLRWDQLAGDDPLSVSYASGRILDVFQCKSTRKAVGAKPYVQDEQSVELRFGFLGPGDGFKCLIFRDGAYAPKPTIHGTVVAVRGGLVEEEDYEQSALAERPPLLLFFSVLFGFCILMLSFGLYSAFSGDTNKSIGISLNALLLTGILILLARTHRATLMARRRMPRTLVEDSIEDKSRVRCYP